MKEAAEGLVRVEVTNGLAVLTLNRPKAYNAINLDLSEELLNAAIECDEDPSVRAVLITGEGPAFCAGGDIRQMLAESDTQGGASAFLKKLTVRLHAAVATFAHMAKPVVTAVNGPAAGAGFSLAIAGDLVVAAESATFTVAYTAIALAPDGSSTHYLPKLVGPKRAYELIATNRPLSAEEAHSMGIVNKVFPAAKFFDQAKDYAGRLAQGPTQALGQTKKLLALGAQTGLETSMEHERRAIADCGRTKNFAEGIAAFLEKRPPKVSGLIIRARVRGGRLTSYLRALGSQETESPSKSSLHSLSGHGCEAAG